MARAGERSLPAGTCALDVRNVSSDTTELMIYGTIGGGGWFDEGGVTAVQVSDALRGVTSANIHVRINSGGGDVFDGVAIHTLLARHPATVTTFIDGIAASAASFIAMAGDRIVSARNAMMMIHGGMTGTYGNANTHRRSADLLDKVSDNIADIYAMRAGGEASEWRARMDLNEEDGVWYTGTEALDAGLVDELVGQGDDEEVNARVRALAPKSIVATLPDPVPSKTEEGALPPIEQHEPNDTFEHRQARAFLAATLRGNARV